MLLNRKCNYCGNEYYVCRSCIKIGSWKNVCCSKECFVKLQSLNNIQPIILQKGENTMNKVVLRAELTNGKTVDITGYDLDLGKFDCVGMDTITYDDIKLFYIPSSELKEITSTIKVQTATQVKATTETSTESSTKDTAVSTTDEAKVAETEVSTNEDITTKAKTTTKSSPKAVKSNNTVKPVNGNTGK